MAIMFAATYPERVTSLVLLGTFARLVADVDYDGLPPEFIEAVRRSRSRPGGAPAR